MVDIDSDIQYEALSYTWSSSKISESGETSPAGGADQCFPILVDGRLHFATSNLYDALQRLCDETETGDLVDYTFPPLEKSKLIIEAEAGKLGEVARLLIQGANIDLQDAFGNTALYYHAENDFLETVRLLLNAGANIDIKTHDQKSALDCCIRTRRWQFSELTQLLLAAQESGIIRRGTFKSLIREKIDYKWIDAVYIDQTNLEECNSQVSQIRKIYRRATRVAIW